MTTWIGQIPALLAALGLLVVPGLPVAFAVRASGVIRLGVAIIVSLAVVGGASLVAPVIGLDWSLLPVVFVAIAVTGIAVLIRLLQRGQQDRPVARGSKWSWLGVALAAIGWTVILIYGIGGSDHPNQLYDAIYHLNAVEYILQNGDASSLHMTMVTPGATTGFYPALWHALVSLVVPLSGSVVAATNVVTIAVVALIWPVSVATLTSVAFPRRPNSAAWAAVSSFGFGVFPLGFLNWGVLYPNLLGMVLLPLFLAVVIVALKARTSWSFRVLWGLVALAAAGATALSHPSALLAGIALLVPYALWRIWTVGRGARTSTRIVLAISSTLGILVLIAIWFKANVTTNAWLPSSTMAQAFGEVLFLSPVGRTAGLLLGPLAALGVWYVVRQRLWWVIASYGVSVAFYMMAAWFPQLQIRSFFVGVWYDDATRVGALLALWGLPLVGLGAATVADAIRRLWRRGARRRVVALVTVLVLLAGTHLYALVADLRFMRGVSFQFGDESQGLSPDEAAVFDAAEDLLDDESLTIGDPLTGAGLLYAYTGHDVVFPHISGSYGPDADRLAGSLASGDEGVCESIARLGVTHALDFGSQILYERRRADFVGLHELEDSPIFTEVLRVGDAALYEVTGCE